MINYAVIGCGVIGKVHCLAIESDPKSNLLFVCDIIPERANDLASIYNCRASYDYEDILINPSVDVITICLPHWEHVKLFEKAIKNGKHVLCEKPLATTPDDIYKMVKLSENTNLHTTAAFQHRHSLLVQTLQSFISKGEFGQIICGELKFSCERNMDYYNSDIWRGKWKTEGGGTLINQAIHTIDLANVFLGNPSSLTGTVSNKYLKGIEVEDFATGQVNYENNRTLSLQAINSKDESWQPVLKIIGSKGSFTLKGSNSLLELEVQSTEVSDELHHIEKVMNEDKSLPGKKCYGNLHNLVFTDFSEALQNNKKPYLSIKEASMANEIVLGFYHSTTTGKTVHFPIQKYKQPVLNENVLIRSK